MINWFNSFDSYIQTIIIIALVATVFMVVQIVIMLIGVDGDLDSDVDIPSGDSSFFDIFGLKLLAVRNIVAFFAIGGWSVVAIYGATSNYLISNIVGVLAGFLAMIGLSLTMSSLMKLQQSGNKDINNAVGKVGTVYLSIPGNSLGFGKVNVLIQETLVEFNAQSEEEILTGSQVIITGVVSDYLIVKKYK